MTTPFGGTGGANLGTSYGKVRIDYETNAAKAVKEAEAVSHSFTSVGGAATSAASEVSHAAAQINKFAAQTANLNRKGLKNPADGLGKSVQNEVAQANKALGSLNTQGALKVSPKSVQLDQGALSKAIANFKTDVIKGMNIDAPIHIRPSDVSIDAAAFGRAIQNWKSTATKELSIDDFMATVKVNPQVVGQSRTVGKAAHDAFCAESKKIEECGSAAGTGFGARLLASGRGAASKAGSGIASAATTAIGAVGKAGLGAAAGGVAAAVGGIGLVLAKGFSRLNKIDEARNKLLGLKHSAGEVNSIMDSALKSVDKTAFSLDEAANTAAQAVAAGVKPGEDLTKYLKLVADNAAIAGTSMDEMGYVFNKVATSGKLTGEELDQLQDRGIPVLQFLGDEYGVTAAKARDMVSNGEVDFAHFRAAMNANEGAAAKMGNSIGGSFKNLMASVARLGAGLLAPIFGSSGDQISTAAQAIQWLTDQVDKLGKMAKSHAAGLIDFWANMGKGALLAGHVVVDVVGWILEGIGKMLEGIGHVPSAFAGIFDFFGAHGIADNLRGASDNMTKWGNSVFGAGQKVFTFNGTIDKGWGALEEWAKKAKDAANQTAGQGDAAAEAAPKTIELKDALDKLQVKSTDATKSIKGTNAEFRSFLETLKEKNAPQDVIDQLLRIRQGYENGGRAVESFAQAMDKLADSTADADDKAKSYISSLQRLGVIPADDALDSYNEKFRELTDYSANLVDPLDRVGQSLINMDGTINTTSKNGDKLRDSLTELRDASVALVASGQASPEEAYGRTVAGMQEILKQFQITGPAADAIISKYFPQDAFVDAIKKGGDPKGALEELFKDDPAKLQSELNVLTTTQDILGQVLGPDGTLHIPTVLDVPGAGQPGPAPSVPGQPGPGAPGTPGPNVPAPSGNRRPTVGETTTQGWTNVAGQGQPPLLVPKNAPALGPNNAAPPGWYWEFNDPNSPEGSGVLTPLAAPQPGAGLPQAPAPGVAVTPQNLPGILTGPGGANPLGPQMIPGVPIGPTPHDFSEPPDTRSVWAKIRDALVPKNFGQGSVQYQFPDDVNAKLNDEDKIREILSQNKDLQDVMGPRLDAAKASGKSFSEAFADGINSGDEEVKKAIEQIALLAGAGLGQSPALYGPLSGKGWSLYRGQKFTQDWAKGIASQADSVKGGVTAVAQVGVDTFDEKWTKTIKDLQEFSDFGKHALDLSNQLSDIAFSGLGLMNTLSGGRMFPKNYVKDTEATAKQGSPFGSWSPQGWKPPTSVTGFGNAGPVNLGNLGPSKKLQTGPGLAPAAQQLSALLEQQFPGITQIGGQENRPAGTPQMHTKGRAIDVGIGNNLQLGDQINSWLQAHAAQFGIQSTIWRDVGKNLVANEGGGPGSTYTAGGHFDHVHVQFADGAVADFGPGGVNVQAPQGITAPTTAAPPAATAGIPTTPPPAGAPGALGPQAGKQDIANYIINKAMSLGYSRQQANYFATQGFGESAFSPTASNPAGWEGIFQFDKPTWQSAGGGDMHNAQQNIDNYFNLAKNRGLTPQSFTDPTQLGTQVSIGGPYHPANVGHRQRAEAGVAPFLAGAGTNVPGMTPQDPLNVTLPTATNQALLDTGWNSGSLPGIPPKLQELADANPGLLNALNHNITSQDDAVSALQGIDSAIADQNRLGTPDGKNTADALGTLHSTIQSQWGLKEAPSGLEQAQTMVQGMSGIASDVFGVLDDSLKYIAALQDTGDILVRGISNTADVMKLIDDFQTGIQLAARIFQTAGDITSFAGSFSGGADFGGTAAAGQALSMIGQALQAVNTAIDLGQEAYKITTKYVGRFLTSWFGFPGANDIKFLLDEMTGQLKVYTSDNPEMKSTFNTLGKELGSTYPGRPSPTNNFVIYQGPGQDPRDTMDDAMFSVRASGVGAFGYAD